MPLSQEEFADNDDNVLFRSIKVKDWETVRDLLSTTSENRNDDTTTTINSTDSTNLLREVDIYDNTPLHAAIGYQAPDDIMLRMLELYPAATRIHGANEWLPLHVAAMWGSSPDVMTALIQRYPQGLDDRGEGGIKGRTPRHFQNRFPHNQDLLSKSTEDWIESLHKSDKV